jgi:predicted nucleic acid-binding protein
MKAVLADTGPLYAVVDRHDQYHHRATSDLERLRRQGVRLVTIYPVVLETYKLLLRHLGQAAAHTWLEELERFAVVVNPALNHYAEAVRLVRRYSDQALTLEDALIAIVGERLGVPIWTFDHHFDILGAAVWR